MGLVHKEDTAASRPDELHKEIERELELSDELVAETYDLLRSIASRHLRNGAPIPTLNTTLVVHEAWEKLSRDEERRFANENHFLATASRVMRQIIIDYARRKLASKRGAGSEHVCLDNQQLAEPEPEVQLLELEAALARLAKHAPHLERLVEYRFFAGLTMRQAAEMTNRPLRTVERDWERARAYLAAYITSH
ncbi:ECF-type sigma factor [Erythrobacter sp.]|uniref:ECF-type sigma factor n=1 Tax=Erythrobacter sp. TaxID=1042 RepID=UPI0025EC631F|nr:ECF-type sigma factor [Erythrobacter sp.]